MQYPAALAVVRQRVKPSRDERVAKRAAYRIWWQFLWPRPVMRAALSQLSRYIAGTATGKRILFAWTDPHTCPSNAMNVFAFEDDYVMGILCSRVHQDWARLQSSTLEDRIRYTPTSAFETFPFPPDPTDDARRRIADAARALLTRRSRICEDDQIGLTTLYNRLDEGAYVDLARLHAELEGVVVAAYRWPGSVVGDAIGDALLDLNAEIAAGRRSYHPF